MAELRCQGIAIDDNNDPATENVPRQGETTAGTGNRRREGIILPQKPVNLQNSFASLGHYSHAAILCMSLLQLFLIMFPEDYLEQVRIPDNNKGLNVPKDLQEFINWVGCWIYMACWVVIEIRWDWWSTTTPLMAKYAPFRLNQIISSNQFDSILSALHFTNIDVPYKDGFFHMLQLEGSWNQNMAQLFLPS